MKVAKEKAIDNNLLKANIKLMDDKKELEDIIKRATRYISSFKEQGIDYSYFDFESLLKILKGKVE